MFKAVLGELGRGSKFFGTVISPQSLTLPRSCCSCHVHVYVVHVMFMLQVVSFMIYLTTLSDGFNEMAYIFNSMVRQFILADKTSYFYVELIFYVV